MQPWHNEHPLTEDQAGSIIREDVPGLDVRGVRYLTEGWDFTAYAVETKERTWLFRFPKRAECARRLEDEYVVLDELAAMLTRSTIRVPQFEYRITRPRSFALAYGGYAMIPGVPLLERQASGVDTGRIASEVSQVLNCVHALTPWPRPAIYRDPFPGYVVDFRHELDAMSDVLPPPLATAMHRLMTTPHPPYTGEPRFTHADLGTEHILIDERGAAVGIIDWGDAAWGDPHADLVGLWAWGGDPVVRACLDTICLQLDENDWARLRYRGACVCIGQAYYGHAADRPDLLEAAVRWLWRMFEAGQLEDVRVRDW